MSLADSTAVVTGASSGIGKAIAAALARRGVRLALNGRNRERLEEAAAYCRDFGAEVHTFVADLYSASERATLAREVEEVLGDIDILVNSAGMIDWGSVADTSAEVLEKTLTLNTVAPYDLTHRFMPALKRSRGHVVFINSMAGKYAAANLSAYCASKFALAAISESLRAEAGEEVRVLSVFPGMTDTPMLQDIIERRGESYAREEYVRPEQIAHMVAEALGLEENAQMPEIVMRTRDQVKPHSTLGKWRQRMRGWY